MKKHIKIGLIMAAFLLLTGCNYRVTVISSPSYGILYANGERVGLSQVRLSYKIPKECVLHDSIILPKFSAHWHSFATKDTIQIIPKEQKRTTIILTSSKCITDSTYERNIYSARMKLKRAKSKGNFNEIYRGGY